MLKIFEHEETKQRGLPRTMVFELDGRVDAADPATTHQKLKLGGELLHGDQLDTSAAGDVTVAFRVFCFSFFYYMVVVGFAVRWVIKVGLPVFGQSSLGCLFLCSLCVVVRILEGR